MRYGAFAFLLLLPLQVGANELLRLYQQALQSDAQLQAAAAARDAAKEANPQAFAALLPQINAGAQISKQYDDTSTSSGLFCNGAPATSCSNQYTNHGLSLTLDQVLYNREALTRLKQSDIRSALADAGYRNTQQTLALRVTAAYFNTLAAADSLRFAEAERAAVERSLEQARQRFEVGLSAITDVQEAQARYDLTVAQKIQAEQAIASAREGLAEIVGPVEVALAPLTDTIPLRNPIPDDAAAWVRTAIENNPQIISAQLQAEIAEKDIEILRSGHYPTLGLQAEVTDGESRGSSTAERTQETISLQLRVPIYAGGAVSSRVDAARSLHKQRLAELETVRRQAERQTKDAYQGVLTGIALVKAQKQAVVSNITALESSEVGLQVGARTAIDVLNAQRELFRAQRDYSRARYDYLLNVLRLKLAAGRLDTADLAEIDTLLTP